MTVLQVTTTGGIVAVVVALALFTAFATCMVAAANDPGVIDDADLDDLLDEAPLNEPSEL
jgi:hypothetical protein